MRRTALLPLFALVAALLALAAPADAAATLDPEYGDDGVATAMTFDAESEEPEPVLSFFGDIDPMGRVVRAALNTDTVVRLDASGQQDTSFGDDGVAVLPEDFEPVFVDATDDGILVGGDVGVHAAVAKLTDDGMADEDFGDAGVRELSDVPSGSLLDVDLAPAGDVTVLVGRDLGEPVDLYRFLPDGSVNEDFGDDGMVTRVADDLDSRVFEGLDADDQGVVFLRNRVGDSDDFDEQDVIVVERLGLDGEPDPTFGADGVVVVPGGAVSVDIDESDGSVYFGGVNGEGAAIWHLLADGRVDPRFSASAGVSLPLGFLVVDLEDAGSGRVAAIAQAPGDASVVTVLGPDGEADPAFATPDGLVVPGEAPLAGAVGVDSAGRILTYTFEEGNGSITGERARAYLTDFADLAPAVTDITPYETSLSVEWDAPEDEGEDPIRIYHLLALQGDEVAGQSVVAGDLRQASIEGLDPLEESYGVVVLPYDDFGPRLASGVVEVAAAESAPAAGPAPVVPGVEVTAGRQSATVSWDALQDDGGSTLWGYAVVAVQHSGGALAGWRNVRADARTASLPGLTNGTAHDVYVFAVTSEGFGAIGSPVVVTPTGVAPASLAPQVSWASAVPVGANAVVTWGPTIERGEPTLAVHVIVIEGGTMTQWKAMTAYDRQVVVPAAPGAQVYVIAQSASGFGPLTGPITV